MYRMFCLTFVHNMYIIFIPWVITFIVFSTLEIMLLLKYGMGGMPMNTLRYVGFGYLASTQRLAPYSPSDTSLMHKYLLVGYSARSHSHLRLKAHTSPSFVTSWLLVEGGGEGLPVAPLAAPLLPGREGKALTSSRLLARVIFIWVVKKKQQRWVSYALNTYMHLLWEGEILISLITAWRKFK